MPWAPSASSTGNHANLTKDQIAAVRALSRQVIAQLELRRANQQLEQASQALEKSHRSLEQRTTQLERSRDALAGLCDELEIQSERDEKDLARAEAIQRSLLPRELPDLPGCSLQTLYRPGAQHWRRPIRRGVEG